MKNVMLAAGAAFALAVFAVPACAQSDAMEQRADDVESAMIAADMAAAFPVEPLTTEQQARLPLARSVVDGALEDEALFDAMAIYLGGTGLDPAMMQASDSNSALMEALNWGIYLEIEPNKAERALALIDPAYREREAAQNAAALAYAREQARAAMPVMREALAESYAIHFDEAQLRDIAGFYATPTGREFARRIFTVVSDQRLSSRLYASESYWGMSMAYAERETAGAAFPPRRQFSDLSERERAHLAALTGTGEAELEEAMNISWDANDPDAAAEAAMDAMESMD